MNSEEDLKQSLHDAGLEQDDQGGVQWQEYASQHPRGWNQFTKLYNVVIVTWLEFFMTAISFAGVSIFSRSDCTI